MLVMCGCGRHDVVSHTPPKTGSHITHASSARSEPVSSVPTYRVIKGDTLYGIAFRHGVDYRDLAQWNGISAPYKIYVGRKLRMGPPGSVARSTVSVATGSATQRPTAKPSENNKPDNTAAASQPLSTATTPTIAPTTTPAQTSIPSTSAAPPTTVTPPNPSPSHEPVASGGVAWRWPGKGAMITGYVAGDQTRQGIDIAGKAGDPVMAAAEGSVVYSGNGLVGYGELIIIKHNDSFLSAYGHNRKRLVEEGQRVNAGQQIAEMGSSSASRDMLHFEIRKNGKPINPLDYLPMR